MSPAAGKTSARRDPRRSSRRVWTLLALAVSAAAAAATFAPWTFSSKALYEEVAGQLKRSTGLFVATSGRSAISLLPRPHIILEQVFLADPSSVVTVHTERMRGNLNLLRLAAGRLEFSDVALQNPKIVVDLDRRPVSAEGTVARAAAAQPSSPQALKSDRERLGAISIVGGQAKITYRKKEETLKEIDATLEWPTVGAPATLTGGFKWRGERLQALLWIARPGGLLRGEATPVTTRLDADSLHLEAEGMGQIGAKPHFTGRISGSSPSLRQAVSLLGGHMPLPAPIEHVQLAAQASIGLRELQLTNLRLFASDNEFQGTLIVHEEEGRPIVTGALSANFLSLRPLTADLPALTTFDGQWNRDAFELPNLDSAEIDLRFLAAHARLARMSLDDAELSLKLRGRRLEIALNGAKAYKGSVKGRAIFDVNPGEGVACHVSAQTVGVDAGMLLWDTAAKSDISGNLDSSMTLDATGGSVAEVMRNLDGRATFSMTQGAIDGVNLERALRRFDKSPLSSAIDIRTGRSNFDRAGASITVESGTATIKDGFVVGSGFSLAFLGSARIPDRSLAITATAVEASNSGAPREKGSQIGFELSGSWDEPSFTPDAQALIKRSGAAAPLFPRFEAPPPRPLE
jgi:AsmA protein